MPDLSRLFNISVVSRTGFAIVAFLTGPQAVIQKSGRFLSKTKGATSIPAARKIALRRIRSDMYELADQLMHLDTAVPARIEIHDPAHTAHKSRKDLNRFLS